MATLHVNRTVRDTTIQFLSIIDRLLSLTSTKLSDKKQINACLSDLNELDYRWLDVVNNDVRISITFIFIDKRKYLAI